MFLLFNLASYHLPCENFLVPCPTMTKKSAPPRCWRWWWWCWKCGWRRWWWGSAANTDDDVDDADDDGHTWDPAAQTDVPALLLSDGGVHSRLLPDVTVIIIMLTVIMLSITCMPTSELRVPPAPPGAAGSSRLASPSEDKPAPAHQRSAPSGSSNTHWSWWWWWW